MEAAEQDVSLGSPNKFVSPEGKEGERGPQVCDEGRGDALSGGEVATTTTLTEEERELLTLELAKVEEEVATLRQVLLAKEQRVWSIKRSLGMTPLSWQTVSGLMQDVQASTAYKRTSETLSTAGQKTTSAISTVGSALTRRLGDVNYTIRPSISMPAIRNSPTFKSLEEKVESTVSTIKARVSRSTSRSGSISEGLGASDIIQEAEEAEEEGVKIPVVPGGTGGPGATDRTVENVPL
ncbi:tumor protein D53-like isoform X2 [Lethenteron reissneri]|uniref:tumor protein D53-like isoform X2 n=1 Tax=Lethenteron reissneri TaxID=7753 RepID=UPI002AB5F056|nr:tumor protein D53-like isoform X2 [Lethenteron reissneri]